MSPPQTTPRPPRVPPWLPAPFPKPLWLWVGCCGEQGCPSSPMVLRILGERAAKRWGCSRAPCSAVPPLRPPPSPNAFPHSDAHRSSESEISLKRKTARLLEKMQELTVSRGCPGAAPCLGGDRSPSLPEKGVLVPRTHRVSPEGVSPGACQGRGVFPAPAQRAGQDGGGAAGEAR